MQVSATNGGTMELIGTGRVYVHFLVMSNELNTPKVVFCPAESNPKRRAAWTFNSTTPPGVQYQNAIPFTNDDSVSYFVGVDAVGTSPQIFLAGDDNWTVGGLPRKRGVLSIWTNTPVAWTKKRHVNQGNIALADGSVQGFSSAKLREAIANSGNATNRIAFP